MSLPKCATCDKWVHGYTWVMPFSFINGERQPGIEECHMSCGCVVTMPGVGILGSLEEDPAVAVVSIHDMTGSPVLTFYDRFEEAS